MEIEYEGGSGQRQTGKTTRALQDCRKASAAIYIALHAEMAHCAPRLLGETPRFVVTYPTRELPRGMRPDLVVVDCYDLFEPRVLGEIKTQCSIMGTKTLRLIHSGAG